MQLNDGQQVSYKQTSGFMNGIIILFNITFEGMTSSVSVESDGKMNDTLSGNKFYLKVKDIDWAENKMINLTDKNLDDLLKQVEEKFTAKTKKGQVLIIVNERREEIEFNNDEEFIKFIEKRPTLSCVRIPIQMSKRVRKLMQTEKVEIEPDRQENNILGKQILQENYLSPRNSKREEQARFQAIKEENEPEVKDIFTTYHGIIEDILKEPSNLRKITQYIKGQNKSSQPTLFNFSCSFCKKSQFSNKIYACEMNLSIVSCQECSLYLHYRLPYPFKTFTNPNNYQAELSSQSPTASAAFNAKLKEERKTRNRTLKEKLSRLSLQA